MKRNSKGRPAGSGCVSRARQAKNNQKGLEAERARMTKNDVNVLLPAKQASSTPSQGLLFEPSPRQQAALKKNVKQEEEPIGKQDNTTDTLASANTQSKGSHKDALTNSTQETPCEKGVSTSRQQGHSKKLRETSMAAGKQQVKQEETKKLQRKQVELPTPQRLQVVKQTLGGQVFHLQLQAQLQAAVPKTRHQKESQSSGKTSC